MEYNRLPVISKRYSFESKMQVLNYYSSKSCNINGMIIDKNLPHPWELEQLLMFFVKSKEYSNKNLFINERNKFVDMVNCVRTYIHPFFKKNENNIENYVRIVSMLGMTEFNVQEYPIYRLYRYNYFFNYNDDKIDVKTEFKNKFKVDYNNFCNFGFQILAISTTETIGMDYKNRYLNYLIKNNFDIFNYLVISRDDFSKLIDNYSMNNIDNYLYCVRPSYTYPFINYNDTVFFPLPHTIVRTVTDSMLFRLTDKNIKLRDKFGNVFESYVYKILNDSKVYDEVLEERVYNKKKNLKTSDVMCKKNNTYLFIECKLTVPSTAIRCVIDDDFENQKKRYVSAIDQLFKQLYKHFGTEYNFFEKKEDINKNNCYGLVVVLEENYISRDLIFNEVKKICGYTKEELDWVKKHIYLCSVIDIERFSFTNSNIIDSLISQVENKKYFDYPLQQGTKNEINQKLLDFTKYLKNELNKSLINF